MEARPRILFRRPDGRRKGLIFSALSIGCLLGWVYFGVVHGGPHLLLFLGVAFACTGVAESLPTDRRRLAGLLRLLGLGVVAAFIGLLVSNPEIVLG